MQITIVSPLFPPDIGAPAPYVKELAGRLTAVHGVSVVCFGNIPESVDNVTIYTVSKRAWGLIRVWRLFLTLRQVATNSDVLYVQNGPSVELATLLFSYTNKTPIVLAISDFRATARQDSSWIRRWSAVQIAKRARRVLTFKNTEELILPTEKPEILPFGEHPTAALNEYQDSWEQHIDGLNTILPHVR
ncbi:MAG: hypothetical protein AAFO91_16695 [Bacteroidota bacterium]